MAFRLLFADDSATMHRVVQITLAREDAEIIAVNTGRDAFLRAQQARPDIIILDVNMPEMDGYAACQAIKDDPNTGHIPVLLLASSQEPLDTARAQDCGADGHILKPFDTQAFIDKVKQILATSVAAPTAASMQASAQQAAQQPMPQADLQPANHPATQQAVPQADLQPAHPPSAQQAMPQAGLQPVAQPQHQAHQAVAAILASSARGPSTPFAGITTPSIMGPQRTPVAAPEDARATRAVGGAIQWSAPPTQAAPRHAVPGAVAARATSTSAPLAAVGLAARVAAAGAQGAVATAAKLAPAAAGSLSTQELLAAAEKILEKVAWEVVPPLAEALIKQHIDRAEARLQEHLTRAETLLHRTHPSST